MQFIINLTWREVRSSWRRLLFFFVCIGIGVGSIVALRSVIQNLNRAVAAEARFLLVGDVEINTTSAFTDAEKAAIEQVLSSNANRVEARDEIVQTSAMARPSDASKPGTQMLELKGIESNFPLVGEFKLADGTRFDYKLLENKGAVVAPLVLERLNLSIGDSIRIGNTDFQIRGKFDNEPGGTTGFRLGPRVFIERSRFEEAGLTGFGSRNRYKILFRTVQSDANNADALAKELQTALKNAGSLAVVRSYKEAQENLAQSFERAENYLSLTGLVILVLGGIGVWNVTRVFVEQKKTAIATLKCLGASGTSVTFAYLLQILSLSLLGGWFGVALAQIALFAIQARFGASLPPQMSYNLRPNAILQGFLLGLLISALFSLLPLLTIRNIKPRLLLRDSANETLKRFSIVNFAVGAIAIFGLLAIAVWQANSWRIGVYFLLGLAATALVLYVTAFVLTKILRAFRVFPSFALKQSINSLSRPGNQTRVILLAVGLGVFVVLSVQLLQSNLLREFDLTLNGKLPALFLIDIKKSQADQVRNQVREETGETIDYIPAVRGRIFAINGEQINSDNREIRRQGGQIGREYVLTYRPDLVGEEAVTEGAFWNSGEAAREPEISLAEDMKESLKVNLNDEVTFDISGQKIAARVTSFRRLDVRNPRSTFLIVFRPGALENAPQTLLAPVYAEIDQQQRSRLQRALVDKFPNVSAIDTADAISAIKRLLDNITLAVSFVGGFVFLSGALILIGSIALTKFQRVYENAILKTLGAKRRILTEILLLEYGLLGLLAAIVGVGAATALSYLVANYVFKIAWFFDLKLTLLGLFATILLVMLVGAISSFDVIFRKPLGTLRSQ